MSFVIFIFIIHFFIVNIIYNMFSKTVCELPIIPSIVLLII